MRRRSYILTFLLTVIGASASAQALDDSNWYKLVKDVDDYYSRFDFTRYSKEDVLAAVPLFKRIEQAPAVSEWEGVYSTQVAIGESELRMRSKQGYVFHYVYHTLESLDYGAIEEDSVSVRLVSGRAWQRVRSPLFSDRLIKVKWGRTHFLVPESRLKDFAERAVGRETSDLEFWHYWSRSDENELEVEGRLAYPPRYAHLVVSPLETRIVRIGRRIVVPSEYTTKEVNYDVIYISVALAGGSHNGLKQGMDFFVPKLGEWVEVTKAGPHSSIGRIRRNFGEGGLEQCWDTEKGSGKPFPCKKLIAGIVAFTKPN